MLNIWVEYLINTKRISYCHSLFISKPEQVTNIDWFLLMMIRKSTMSSILSDNPFDPWTNIWGESFKTCMHLCVWCVARGCIVMRHVSLKNSYKFVTLNYLCECTLLYSCSFNNKLDYSETQSQFKMAVCVFLVFFFLCFHIILHVHNSNIEHMLASRSGDP